jgi:hypothetical protein
LLEKRKSNKSYIFGAKNLADPGPFPQRAEDPLPELAQFDEMSITRLHTYLIHGDYVAPRTAGTSTAAISVVSSAMVAEMPRNWRAAACSQEAGCVVITGDGLSWKGGCFTCAEVII